MEKRMRVLSRPGSLLSAIIGHASPLQKHPSAATVAFTPPMPRAPHGCDGVAGAGAGAGIACVAGVYGVCSPTQHHTDARSGRSVRSGRSESTHITSVSEQAARYLPAPVGFSPHIALPIANFPGWPIQLAAIEFARLPSNIAACYPPGPIAAPTIMTRRDAMSASASGLSSARDSSTVLTGASSIHTPADASLLVAGTQGLPNGGHKRLPQGGHQGLLQGGHKGLPHNGHKAPGGSVSPLEMYGSVSPLGIYGADLDGYGADLDWYGCRNTRGAQIGSLALPTLCVPPLTRVLTEDRVVHQMCGPPEGLQLPLPRRLLYTPTIIGQGACASGCSTPPLSSPRPNTRVDTCTTQLS